VLICAVWYTSAPDGEHRIIEAAPDAIGRQPQRRGETLTCEPAQHDRDDHGGDWARAKRANPSAAQLRPSENPVAGLGCPLECAE
jgi:hypothetical protein